jgi:ABC-2 type transport system permease protein
MSALAKLTLVEMKLFLRDPLTLIFTFAFPFFVLFILAGTFGNELESEEDFRVWRGVGPTDYYVPAYVALVIASIGLLALPLRLAAYRERGVLKRFRASALPLTSVLGSQLLVAVLMAIIGAISITIAARIAFDTMMPGQAALVFLAFVLSVAAFSAIGLLLGAVIPNARAAQAGGLILFFVMMFISGAGPPREVLDRSMQVLGDFLPLTHVILVLQNPWLGHGWHESASIIVLGFTAVAASLAALLFRWE